MPDAAGGFQGLVESQMRIPAARPEIFTFLSRSVVLVDDREAVRQEESKSMCLKLH
jgi:hypothetical protein